MSAIDSAQDKLSRIRAQVARVILGQEELIQRLLIGVMTGGHLLLEGAPGVAKTLAARTLAQALGLQFQRIQFTPDLLPADLVGTEVFDPHAAKFSIRQGPVFTQVLLADEINRAPAKVQSALLEAMQERQVTLGPETRPLPTPFLVLATQNPIEHQGTYPLPEAQLDRFLMKLVIDYPSRDDERAILQRHAHVTADIEVEPVASASEVARLQQAVESVYLDPKVADYLLDLVRATRRPDEYGLKLHPYIEWGASPRAAIALTLACKALALLSGRDYVVPHDVKSTAVDVLRHRLVLTFEAEAEGITSDVFLEMLLRELPVP